MIVKHKRTIIITSLLILLPMLAGILLWSRLPDTIATHFGPDGIPNGYSSKAFTVLGLTGIMLLLHWICIAALALDPKSKNIGKKPLMLTLWLVPLIACTMQGYSFAYALGITVNIALIVQLLLGIIFLLLGNVLPKAQQNFSLGFRTRWALNSTKNWAFTHRVAGWAFTIGGFITLVTAFLKHSWLLTIIIILMIVIPFSASLLYYQRFEKNDE